MVVACSADDAPPGETGGDTSGGSETADSTVPTNTTGQPGTGDQTTDSPVGEESTVGESTAGLETGDSTGEENGVGRGLYICNGEGLEYRPGDGPPEWISENPCEVVDASPDGRWLVWADGTTIWVLDPEGEVGGIAKPDTIWEVSVSSNGTIAAVSGYEVFQHLDGVEGWTSVFDFFHPLEDAEASNGGSWALINPVIIPGDDWVSQFDLYPPGGGYSRVGETVLDSEDERRFELEGTSDGPFLVVQPTAGAPWSLHAVVEDEFGASLGDALIDIPPEAEDISMDDAFVQWSVSTGQGLVAWRRALDGGDAEVIDEEAFYGRFAHVD